MPGRTTPLISNYYYHVYNRSIASQPIFTCKRDYARFFELINYYKYQDFPGSFSKFKKLSRDQREDVLSRLAKSNDVFVEMICFCLMPTHFHFLLKQVKDKGVSVYLSNLQNSYTRYFNQKYERIGPLFQGPFKSVLVQTEHQLLHLSRYIHLNPYSSGIAKDSEQLESYPWSSLPEYLELKETSKMCQKDVIWASFGNLENYKNFVFDHKDYQKELERIKHLIIE